MKKLIKGFLTLPLCLALVFVTAQADAYALEQQTVSQPEIIQVSKEEAQRFRAENGLPYDENVTGGFIVYSNPVGTSSDVVLPSEIGGNEYFIKNPQTSYRIGYSEPFEPGASGCNMNLTASASFSRTTTLTGSLQFTATMLTVITATIGGSYSIGDTLTVSNSGSKTVTGCAVLKGYPRYEEKTGELWEDDVWFDDFISNYKATKLESIYYESRKM